MPEADGVTESFVCVALLRLSFALAECLGSLDVAITGDLSELGV